MKGARLFAIVVLTTACGETSRPPTTTTSPAGSSGPVPLTDPGPTAPPPSPRPTTTTIGTTTSEPTETTAGCSGNAPGPDYVCVRGCGRPVQRDTDPPPPMIWAKKSDLPLNCPRCLRRGTKIATPTGDVAVERLHVGDPIFTVDAAGRRFATTVRLTSFTPAPRDHRMVRIRLADGRVLVASPGHPTIDGAGLGTLATGAVLDRAKVVSVETLDLDDDRTFDVLPEGGTGDYWADGVVLGSTLSR